MIPLATRVSSSRKTLSLLALLLLATIPGHAAVFTVSTTNDSGAGSFRQALLSANSTPGPNTIEFNLPGKGPRTIAPLTPLPEITNSVSIDAYSQPGSRQNTDPWASHAILLVRLDGWQLTNGLSPALVLRASGCSVRGLIIVRFSYGIQIINGSGNVIAGNWIGMDFDGIARGMTFEGISFTYTGFNSAMHNTIGGPAAVDRNVISGNRYGVSFFPERAANNSVIGNLIGTDPSGCLPRGNLFAGVRIQTATNILVKDNVLSACTASGGSGITVLGGGGHRFQGNLIGHGISGQDLGNFADGISLQGATGVLIGGTEVGAGNRIGFNRANGISLNGCTGTTIQQNNIGTGSVGYEPYGNALSGIYLIGSSSNLLGGVSGPNFILYNGAAGITVFSGTENRISANHLYDNAGLGIDLGDTGPAANDAGDTDTGANQLQNYPELTAARLAPGSAQVDALLNSEPNTLYHFEFFIASDWDPLGFGEGRIYLGATDASTDGTGTALINYSGPAEEWMLDSALLITATATDPAGNTSEFSPSIHPEITLPPPNLNILSSAGNCVLQWPSTAENFVPEYTTSLTPPIQWQTVTNPIVLDSTLYRVTWTNAQPVTPTFFRLRKTP